MIRNFGAAVAGGLLLALSFPNAGLFYTAWISFIPLFFVLQSESNLPFAALYGGVFQGFFALVDVNWIYQALVVHGHFHWLSAGAVFLCLVTVLSLFGAVFGFVVAYGLRKGVAISVTAPITWIGLEYTRTFLFTGFPWDLAGYSQAPLLTIMQVSDITGIYGVSFLVVVLNAAIWEVLQHFLWHKPLFRGVLIYCLLVWSAAFVYGVFRLDQVQAVQSIEPVFPIGVLQGNIAQEMKWEKSAMEYSFDTYEELAIEAKDRGARLILWPETSVPALVATGESQWRAVLRISEKIGAPMLVGAPSYKDSNGKTLYFNSAFLISDRMLRFRYDKMHLVPFAEYMPLDWLVPLGSGLAVLEADYTAGKTMEVMKVNKGPSFSVLICYEAIFPGMSRLAVRKGATVLVNIVNDGWFAGTSAPYQHLIMAGVRSIENRVALVRAANTGISAVFEPTGRMVGSIPWNTRGILVMDIPSGLSIWSFYREFGDLFAIFCVILCCCMILWVIRAVDRTQR